jgi:hypothetical protein
MHDLLDDPDQAMFDLAVDRERRREQHGVRGRLHRRAPSSTWPAAAARAKRHRPATRSLARTFHSLVEPVADEPVADGPGASAADVAAVVEVLVDSGVLEPPVRALLEGAVGDVPRPRPHPRRAAASRSNATRTSRRAGAGSSAISANTLISGCSLQARPFTPQEASDAVLATCNLGLENWPAAASDDILMSQDLVGVFQIGWAILHEKVGSDGRPPADRDSRGVRYARSRHPDRAHPACAASSRRTSRPACRGAHARRSR